MVYCASRHAGQRPGETGPLRPPSIQVDNRFGNVQRPSQYKLISYTSGQMKRIFTPCGLLLVRWGEYSYHVALYWSVWRESFKSDLQELNFKRDFQELQAWREDA